jgi:hypothetical protein
MMDVILNKTKKATNGQGSINNIPTAAGGLPGVRARTRQTNGTDRPTAGSPNPGGKLGTDTEEDEKSLDMLVKQTLAVPKGQPPKKRTKKYGERKSCKNSFKYSSILTDNFYFLLFFFSSSHIKYKRRNEELIQISLK